MWDMVEQMKKFQKDMNHLFTSYWGQDRPIEDVKKDVFFLRKPLADIRETPDSLVVTIEIPGMNKQDIQLDIKTDRLEVRAEKKQDINVGKEGYHLEERTYKGFFRSLDLPYPVLPEQSQAKYSEGVLEITIPKGPKQEKKHITID